MQEYQKLEEAFKDIKLLGYIERILGWDAAVMMPVGSSENRGEQLAALAKIEYEKILNSALHENVLRLTDNASGLSDWQKANIRQMKRAIEQARAVPVDLAVATAKATNDCEMMWREARKESNFNIVKHQFKEVVSLARQVASARSSYFNVTAYDSMLDLYDPGRKSETVDVIFNKLMNFLPNFVEDVLANQEAIKETKTHYPIEKQKELGLHYMKAFGMDFNTTRLDVSTHPFCGGHPGDIRITTRYDESDFLSGLFGVIHETGHAVYESNLPQGMKYQPVADNCGMSIHESQSLFAEMQIAQSKEFLRTLSKALPEFFQNKNFDEKLLYKKATHVERSFIRVDADEVTYPLHVILRYQLEKKLIEGEIDVDDLPSAWNEMMEKFLKIKPAKDSMGCLQDIHWYRGMFGYFPSYTLGAIFAAQLMAKFKEENKDWASYITSSNFKVIMDWLKERVHKFGSYYSPDELMAHATGEQLTPDYFIDYLRSKYLT